MHSFLFGGGGGGSNGHGHRHAPPAAALANNAIDEDVPEPTPAETHASTFGVHLQQGRRSTMEDFAVARWTRCPSTQRECGLFAVMDGHGGAGAARFLARELLDAVLTHEHFASDLPRALVSAFEATDARYLEREGPAAAAAAAAEEAEKEKQKEEAAAAAGSAAGSAAAAAAGSAAASPRSTPPPRSGFYYYYGAGGARSPGASNRASPRPGGGGGNQQQQEQQKIGFATTTTAAQAPPGDEGSTAVVAVLRSDGVLAIGNVGDSRAVLMRNGRAHTLSVDHKPNVREERLRIEKAGGCVVWSGVWRVGGAAMGTGGGGGGGGGGGLLALSRAFGDRPLKLGAGVIATPDVKVVRLQEGDTVLVLASDGLWDVMNAQEAVLIANGAACASRAAKELVARALERGTLDNVAVVVVKLALGSASGEEEEAKAN